jgi:hypothetical protein
MYRGINALKFGKIVVFRKKVVINVTRKIGVISNDGQHVLHN